MFEDWEAPSSLNYRHYYIRQSRLSLSITMTCLFNSMFADVYVVAVYVIAARLSR